MYAKNLVKESFYGEFHSLLEGMKVVLWSSGKLFRMIVASFFKSLLSLAERPRLVKRSAPDKHQEVDLPADRWLCHYQQPLNRLYMR